MTTSVTMTLRYLAARRSASVIGLMLYAEICRPEISMKVMMTHRVPGSQISQTAALKMRRQRQEGERGEWSRAFRRVRRRRPIAPVALDSEDEPPGLNPSSEEDCPGSDDSSSTKAYLSREIHYKSQTMGYRSPMRKTSAIFSDPQGLRRQQLQFAVLLSVATESATIHPIQH